MDCTELERKLAIAMNTHLSLKKRQSLIKKGTDIGSIVASDGNFDPFVLERRIIIRWLAGKGNRRIVWYGDREFPSFGKLRENLPYMLLCEGPCELPEGKRIAVIGTRHATYGGIQQAYRFGRETAESNGVLVTGVTEGIDQAALKGALDAKGRCIIVLACGHDVEYPYLSGPVRDRVLENGGCVIGPFEPDMVAYKANMIERNLLIAAFCDIAVVVQAPSRSGSLNVCDRASDLGKPVYVGTEGCGDRFVQAGTSAYADYGVRAVSAIRETENAGTSVLTDPSVRKTEVTA